MNSIILQEIYYFTSIPENFGPFPRTSKPNGNAALAVRTFSGWLPGNNNSWNKNVVFIWFLVPENSQFTRQQEKREAISFYYSLPLPPAPQAVRH